MIPHPMAAKIGKTVRIAKSKVLRLVYGTASNDILAILFLLEGMPVRSVFDRYQET